MGIFRLTRRAEQDLLEIAEYTLHTWGQMQTVQYLHDFEKCFTLLAANPYLGRSCDDIRTGLRRFEQRKHVIFYRLHSDGVLISRILHSKMLPLRHSFDT